DIQEHVLGDRRIATDFQVQPDFAAIAQACGCYGEHVEDGDAVEAAVARALEANARGVPAVLDFVVSRERVLGTLEHFAIYPDEMVERARRQGELATGAQG
ncbi:MAG TPA: thiamine pyrophosphate-dependent enzyme, partial [Thermoleophilaceae bacterium]